MPEVHGIQWQKGINGGKTLNWLPLHRKILEAGKLLFVDCKPAIELDSRGTDERPVWSRMVKTTMWERLEKMNWRQPPHNVRYPELAELDAFYKAGRGVPPGNIRVAHNLCVGPWLVAHWGATEAMVTQTNNYVGPDPGFADAAKGDFRLPAGAAPLALGFKPIPFEAIGLCGTVAGPSKSPPQGIGNKE